MKDSDQLIPVSAKRERQSAIAYLAEQVQFCIDNNEAVIVISFDIDNLARQQYHLTQAADDFLQVKSKLMVESSITDFCHVMGNQFLFFSNEPATNQTVRHLYAVLIEIINCEDKHENLSLSMGVAFSHVHSCLAVELINYAQHAMFESKAKGLGKIELFDIEYFQHHRFKAQKLREIASGLRNNEFVMYAQPKVWIESGQPISYELLMRWKHPERGVLSPNHFIPLITGSELDLAFGEYALFKAMEILRLGEKRGAIPKISINVSPKQAMSEQFLGLLQFHSQREAHLLSFLTLEILESEAGIYLPRTLKILQQYRQLGLKVALDDFGTGYSSILSMFELPLDELKIDRSLVKNIHQDQKKQLLLQHTIYVAQQYSLLVVAEGVESQAEAEMLITLGCSVAQGFYYQKPTPVSELWSHKTS
tara:strand:- start:2573 stop:3838 length:1266 start_codon:yes stop_codon:yes gene_type:complete